MLDPKEEMIEGEVEREILEKVEDRKVKEGDAVYAEVDGVVVSMIDGHDCTISPMDGCDCQKE